MMHHAAASDGGIMHGVVLWVGDPIFIRIDFQIDLNVGSREGEFCFQLRPG